MDVRTIGAFCACWFLTGCPDEAFRVRLDLRTDLVPAEEFSGVDIALTTADGESVHTGQRLVRSDENFAAGVSVFSPGSVAAGSYLVHMTLTDARGAAIVTRTTALQVSGDIGFTILITRSARRCDPDSCAPNESCGLGPNCVDHACSELNSDLCPAPECSGDADCQPMATCSEAVCVQSFCFYRNGGSECDPGTEWCSPDDGCLPDRSVDPNPTMDAGVDSAVEVDGAVAPDAEPDSAMDTSVNDDAAADSAVVDARLDAARDPDAPCPPGLGDCDENGSCETPTTDDPSNCGGCRVRCDSASNASPSCANSVCGVTCDTAFRNCDTDLSNGCEIDVLQDPAHCGGCNSPCPGTFPICSAGDCVAVAFPSTGAEGSFAPTEDTTLSAGIHHFSTISIPAGVTVRVDGTGVLELYATGDVLIEGSIDVSGGAGAAGSIVVSNGGGGDTGRAQPAPGPRGGFCAPGGVGGIGFIGADSSGCAQGGRSGGGAGCHNSGGGGGGGGPAGGGGASRGGSSRGGAGGQAPTATAGVGGDDVMIVGGGGEPGQGVYSGQDGAEGGSGWGGGGGSIGLPAIVDLAAVSTFYPGSGGGGGAGNANWPASGGGGGGGALRIASATRIEISATGQIRSDGGLGGSAVGPGGSGSGGIVYLAAPEMSLAGAISAVGGAARGGGGAGGLGRIRISTLPERCNALSLSSTPPLQNGCQEANEREFAYVGRYPN